jgi:hypothetical protein
MHRHNLPWWKKNLGHLKLADVSPPILVECRGKLQRETYTRAKPESKRSLVKGRAAARFSRKPSTVNRYLACLSHVFTVARKEWHWIAHNPFDGVGKFSEGKGSVRFLSEEERAHARINPQCSRPIQPLCVSLKRWRASLCFQSPCLSSRYTRVPNCTWCIENDKLRLVGGSAEDGHEHCSLKKQPQRHGQLRCDLGNISRRMLTVALNITP